MILLSIFFCCIYCRQQQGKHKQASVIIPEDSQDLSRNSLEKKPSPCPPSKEESKFESELVKPKQETSELIRLEKERILRNCQIDKMAT